MESKSQAQQHRQHFNLSDSTKQMLEELTARRYPGKQRRQSQLVEDLIKEAFIKVQTTESVTPAPAELDMELFTRATLEAITLAQQEAMRMGARAIYPEHLLLGVIAQGESRAASLLCTYHLDMQEIRVQAMELFPAHYSNEPTMLLVYDQASEECIVRAAMFLTLSASKVVSPDHLVLCILRHEQMLPFWEAQTRFSLLQVRTALLEGMGVGSEQVSGFFEDIESRPAGRRVAETKQPYGIVAKRSCPSCLREVQVGWKHCVYCGASLKASSCPRCGTPRAEVAEARFCFACGSSLE